ncbi:integrase [Tanacetum coccineum]
MVQVPILQLPDFNKTFIIETDASGVGIRVVLQQKGHPIAFLTLEKLRGYLLDRHFIIKTDHFSLKYLLDQRITTPAQMKWLPKLMGFDYEIMYKRGAKNVVADALSSWQEDSELKARIEKLQSSSGSSKHYICGPDGGHSGMQATIKRLSALVYWKKMRKQIRQFIRQCDVCQRFKLGLVPYPGLLQPLSIPTRIWTEISMDFIDGLPMSRGRPKEWFNWVPLAEYWYNTSYHTTIKTTPYQVVYGQPPPAHITYNKEDNLVDVVDKSLSARESAIELMKFHIKRSQDRMKSLADKHRSDIYFEEVGKVAYKLKLPSSSQIHPVFHVSQLKLYKGPLPLSLSQLPQVSSDGLISEEPFAILDRRLAKKGNVAAIYVLIQWVNGTVTDATWEPYESIAERFPHFDLD